MSTPKARAVINQVFQIGAEPIATPGSGGTANQLLGTFNSQIAPVASGAFGLFRPSGSKYVGQVVPTDTYAEGAYTDTIDLNTLPFMAAGNIGWVAATAGSDGEIVWEHDPTVFGPGTQRTFTAAEGETGAVYNYHWVQVPDLSMRFMRTGASQLTGRLLGKRGTPGITLPDATGHIYYGRAISGLKTRIYTEATWAGLAASTTRMTPFPIDLTFRHNGIFAPWFAMDDSVTSFGGILPDAADTGIQITILADVDSTALDIFGKFNYTAMDNGDNLFFNVYNQGPLIGTTIHYSLALRLSVQISGPPRRANQGPLRVWQWDAICKPGALPDGTGAWPPFALTVTNTLPIASIA